MKWFVTAMVSLVMLVASCSVQIVDVSGSFTGPIVGTQNGTPFSMSILMTLSQSGKEVTGTWSTAGGTSGVLSATVSGDEFSSFTVEQQNPCPGTYVGNARIYLNGTNIGGSYTGNACLGNTTASFDVWRQ